ncbi:monosaccharide ABC transporter ATP-binding protein, CUT2 family [Seinonella peptonophila]|uniref:Monosaccharide ABC transporter ATP-binding protein, CUT2 family n=1 Tax=Seinonella peptonophila TaxID=112248 RepID=A0A1M4T3J0_9BACL|nr:sugar ABC transporter ATP-binding protein [Seinonella peptonophila]SHE39011.1 monosaccharide ABC transporter ATP-binding protein, CUT2 family [Seinonella peptonophila]
MNNPLLKIDNISKGFPGVQALQKISFDVNKGEIHAILGENGAGKSTLMNILSGVYPPDKGSLVFNGSEVKLKEPRHAQELGITMIHQELSLATNMSVMENIFVGRLVKNRFGFIQFTKLEQMAKEALESVGISHISPKQLVGDLNMSHMQLVEIAKALSLKAQLIIMDEPTASLTHTETKLLLEIIRKLKKQGVSILYISHRMEEIFAVSDRITVLRDGKYIGTLATNHTSVQEVVSLMVGRKLSQTFQRQPRKVVQQELPLMQVKNLTTNKVKNVDFSLYVGEMIAITGLVGAGRTEVVEALFGVSPATGTIELNGQEVNITEPKKAIKAGFGLVPEGRKIQGIYQDLSVKENMTIAHLPQLTSKMFIKQRTEEKQTQKFIQKLNIKTVDMERPIKFLSGGNQQKAILARWLLNQPKVLFLDEPTHGVDVGAKMEIYQIIDDLAKSGVGIILISSELPEVLLLADRILVMHEGEIKGELTRKEATQEKIMALATNQVSNIGT